MEISEWKKYDEFYESLMSFRKGLHPVLKLQIVLDSNGKWNSIVRDYGTGKMVGSYYKGYQDINEAKEKTRFIACAFIKLSLKE